eukprot:TRINITY_DN2776_c0_g1_i2.p1 TRINITY_DN2776_c0_g1~~TRINITY_DN2776_c0_g1_i2.p1  ORF type:complete len:529 (-),score=136.95 TRINITY_DN2776_c0_g1_i2:63-1616(-)
MSDQQPNAENYGHWMKLIKDSIVKDEPETTIELFKQFLEIFPLCHMIWIKYSEFLLQQGKGPECKDVLKDATQKIPFCVDIWRKYCSTVSVMHMNDTNIVRAIYHSALENVKYSYDATPLYLDYFKFELTRGQQYQHAFKWARLAIHNYLVDASELFRTLIQMLHVAPVSEIYLEKDKVFEFEPGEIVDDDGLRQKYQMAWTQAHQKTLLRMQSILPFERRISRRYFDPRGLPSGQITSWCEYAKYISEHEVELLPVIFERAAMPCNNYESFWDFRLALTEKVYGLEKACEEAENALRKSLLFRDFGFVNAAEYLERTGDLENSRLNLVTLISNQPYNPLGYLRLSSFLLRHPDYIVADQGENRPDHGDPVQILWKSSLPACVFAASELLERQNIESAIQLVKEFLDRSPTPEAFEIYGRLLIKTHKWDLLEDWMIHLCKTPLDINPVLAAEKKNIILNRLKEGCYLYTAPLYIIKKLSITSTCSMINGHNIIKDISKPEEPIAISDSEEEMDMEVD